MSYTIKPSLASARDRAINLLQIVWHFPGGVPSPGGTSPNRNTGLAGLDNREDSDASRMCSAMVNYENNNDDNEEHNTDNAQKERQREVAMTNHK
jgi:hypothetical protein